MLCTYDRCKRRKYHSISHSPLPIRTRLGLDLSERGSGIGPIMDKALFLSGSDGGSVARLPWTRRWSYMAVMEQRFWQQSYHGQGSVPIWQ